MAPKRSVKISASGKNVQTIAENLSRKRQRKTQPLKVPSSLTISIPVRSKSLDVPDTLRKVNNNIKIALADEVARSQLLNVPVQIRSVSPPKKRGRKKKVVLEIVNKTDGATDVKAEVTQAPIKKQIRKPPSKIPPERRGPVTRKRVADSTVQKPIIKRKKITPKHSNEESIEQEEVVFKKESTNPDSTAKESTEHKINEDCNVFNLPTVTTKKKRNLSLKGKREKVVLRQASPILQTQRFKRLKKVDTSEGFAIKNKNSTTEQKCREKSPEMTRTRSMTKDNPVKVNNASLVDSRKNSISSCSNLSWTREISSSSTNTCIIASSNDIVRFNKKLPLIKVTNLTDIDREINKYKHASVVDDSRNSDDSETSSETSYDRSSGRLLDSPLNSNLFNLSSSSRNSYKNEETNEKLNKKDYEKAAENLMHVLKKIDMEFINWIQVSDYVSSDLNKCKDKFFDILKSEFCALTHCRNLQEISKFDVPKDTSLYNDENMSKADVEIRKNSTKSSISNTDESKNRNSVECAKIEKTKNDNTHNTNEPKTNVTKRITRSQVENNNTITIIPNKENNLVNSVGCNKSEWVKNNTFGTRTVTNHLEKEYSNELDNNKSGPVKCNRYLGNRFTNKIFESSNNKIEDIRIEFNRSGGKKVECNPIQINKISHNKETKNNSKNSSHENKKVEEYVPDGTDRVKTDNVSHKFDETNQPAYSIDNKESATNPTKNTTQSKFEDEMTKPGTSGVASNIIKDTPSFSSDSSNSGSSDSDSSDSNSFTESEEVAKDKDIRSPRDDDDALSLFAESLTGIESSKINMSVISAPTEKQIEEYIPKPVQSNLVSPPNYTYCPTRISEQVKNNATKTVCEKQNADSTSIYKDKDANASPVYQRSVTPAGNPPTDVCFEINTPNTRQRPMLIQDLVQIKPGDFNTIFRGYCTLNLMSRCPLAMRPHTCRYSHKVLSQQEIEQKLSKMDKEIFIKEYMLVRRRLTMLRKYGMAFVFESVRRNYTRMLVEIAFDFNTILPNNDPVHKSLKEAAVEISLLHLNQADLSLCEDLMLLPVAKDSLLCDVFMQVIMCSQNFSRFKPVFLSLTYFMVNNDRTFTLEVAEHLLERVCILPFDEPVIRALIQIMRLTDPKIFQNSMIETFEKQISVNRDVLEEYGSLKKEVNFDVSSRQVKRPIEKVNQTPIIPLMEQPRLVSLLDLPMPVQYEMKPLRVQTMEQPLINRPEGVPLPPSPDTTHLDNLNKTSDDTMVPKITRTIWGLNSPVNYPAGSPSSSNNEELQTTSHKKWQNRSIFQKISGKNFMSPPQARPMRLNRPHNTIQRQRPLAGLRLVTLGGSPVMHPPPAPDF